MIEITMFIYLWILFWRCQIKSKYNRTTLIKIQSEANTIIWLFYAVINIQFKWITLKIQKIKHLYKSLVRLNIHQFICILNVLLGLNPVGLIIKWIVAYLVLIKIFRLLIGLLWSSGNAFGELGLLVPLSGPWAFTLLIQVFESRFDSKFHIFSSGLFLK